MFSLVNFKYVQIRNDYRSIKRHYSFRFPDNHYFKFNLLLNQNIGQCTDKLYQIGENNQFESYETRKDIFFLTNVNNNCTCNNYVMETVQLTRQLDFAFCQFIWFKSSSPRGPYKCLNFSRHLENNGIKTLWRLHFYHIHLLQNYISLET